MVLYCNIPTYYRNEPLKLGLTRKPAARYPNAGPLVRRRSGRPIFQQILRSSSDK